MKSPIPFKKYLARNFGVVAILPVIIIACLVWFFILPSIQQRTAIHHQVLADAIANKISTYLKGGERQLMALARYLGNRKTRVDTDEFSSVVKEKSMELLGLDSEKDRLLDDLIACLPREDQAYFIESGEKAVKNATPWQYEGKFIKPSGEEIWIECRSEPRKAGNRIIYYGLITDISERKQMEQALKENEQLLVNILESMDEGVVMLDSEFNYKLFNNVVEKLSNTPRQKVLGKKPWEAFPELNETELLDDFKKAMKGEKILGKETYVTFPHQKDIWLNESIIPLRDTDDGIMGVLHMAIDITRKKQNEEELRRLRNYLSNIIDSMPSYWLRWTTTAMSPNGTARRRRSPG